MVISVGIDVSKDKHDCFIVSSEGEVLADVFTIPNNMDGFHRLLQRIQDLCTFVRRRKTPELLHSGRRRSVHSRRIIVSTYERSLRYHGVR